VHEALVVDLDGVLRSWAGQGAIKRRHGLPARSLTAVAFARGGCARWR
jgi:hypothetical protein